MIELETSELTNIPSHWQVSTMANETEFITDYVANGSFASLAENVNYKSEPDYAVLIRLTDFNNNYKGDFVYVDKNAYDFLKKSKLVGGEIIISNVGAYAGTVFLAPNLNRPMTLGPNSIMMNFKNGNTFYYYWLKSPMGKFLLEGIISGSAQPKFNKTTFRQMQVPVPALPEQTAIASVLSSLDEKIDLLHRQNATLEKMAETLFRQWFVEEAKEEWESVKVGDFVLTNTSTISKNYQFDVIKYLDTSSLNKGMIGELQSLNLFEAPSRAKRLVKHNDILVSTVRPDQKHFGIIKNPQKNLVVSTGFCVITCNTISPHFIYLLLTSNEMTEFLHSIAEGSTSTYPSLKPSDIEKVDFLLPPQAKINEFEIVVSNYWDKININQTQIRTLTALRDTLLPKLMRGEVRVE